MPVGTCSAIWAGPLPSTTQATAGDGLLGSCGAAKTAPSRLSAAATRSAENGSAMAAPTCKGPVTAMVVVVVDPAAVAVVDVWRDEVGVGEPPEPQAASTSGAVRAARADTN